MVTPIVTGDSGGLQPCVFSGYFGPLPLYAGNMCRVGCHQPQTKSSMSKYVPTRAVARTSPQGGGVRSNLPEIVKMNGFTWF